MISKCPSCQSPIQVPPEAVGKKVRCTGCQAIFVIEPEPVAPAPPPPKPEPAKPKKKKKTTDAEMKPSPPIKKDEPKAKPAEAIKQAEPKKKPDEPKKKPAPKPAAQAAGNPFDFGGKPAGPAGPAADFSFDGQHPADKVNIGVRLRAAAAASFMNYGVAYALIPVLMQIAYSVVMTLLTAIPTFAGVGCCALSLYIVAAVFIVVGARQMEKMRSFGMAMTGAIFSLFLGLGGLLPSVGLSVLLGMGIAARRFEVGPPTLLALGVIVLCVIQFIFSFWGGVRAIMVLLKGEVRTAMGTKLEAPP